MSKARVYEIAKELNVDSKLIIEKLKEMNVEVKNHMSSVTEEDTAKVKQAFQKPEKRGLSCQYRHCGYGRVVYIADVDYSRTFTAS